jgi:hypothetical protein
LIGVKADYFELLVLAACNQMLGTEDTEGFYGGLCWEECTWEMGRLWRSENFVKSVSRIRREP